MPATSSKNRPSKGKAAKIEPIEDRTTELLTIAWTVSVTGVLIADLMSMGAHFLSWRVPHSPQLKLFSGLLLLLAAGMGIISLVLAVAVWRRRKVKPPQGLTVFATCAAAAPIVATIVKLAL